MLRDGNATGPGKTKNPFILNGLAVFDVTLDCAPANNRLKRRRQAKSSEERLPVRAGIRSQQQK